MFNFGQSDNDNTQEYMQPGETIDGEAWSMAESLVLGRNGGFAGVSAKEKYKQIRHAYDQIVESNQQASKWEGKD